MSTYERRSGSSRDERSAGRSRNSAHSHASHTGSSRARSGYRGTSDQRRGTSRGRTGGRNRRPKKDHSILYLSFLLIVLVVIAATLMMTHRNAGSTEVAENSSESTGSTAVISGDLLVDYSAITGDSGDAVLNLKGMNEEQALETLEGKYSWSLKVINTNPKLDEFELPSLPEKVDSASETGADSEGSVQEVQVDDPLANVTIRPTKEEFEVPDQVKPVIEEFVVGIYEDYAQGGNSDHADTESASTSDGDTSGSETAETSADYTLELPDFTDTAKDYAEQLAVIWDDKPKNGDITSYDEDSDSFVFGGSSDGYAFDSDQIASDLADAMNSHNFTASIQAAGAIVSADSQSVEDQYKTISTFTTETTSNEVRNKNIRLACQTVNGTILSPGEEFSFNDVVGERTEEKGYGAAAAYNNGEVVQEIGGGVCQVSSTLFNAVFRAGLTTTYRRSHTFEPSYVTPGMDATVSWGGPDYRFINNSDHAIGIRASYSSRTCTVSIYGVPILEDGETWTLESEKVKDLPLEEPEVITSGTPSAGTQGSVWEVYKIVKKNGEEVSRELDHTTNYKGHRPTVLESQESTAESTETESSSAESTEETSSEAASTSTTEPSTTAEADGPADEATSTSTEEAATVPAPTSASSQETVSAPTAKSTEAGETGGPGA